MPSGHKTTIQYEKHRDFAMKIGTPLGKNPLKIMLLGSGELGKEVIIALNA